MKNFVIILSKITVFAILAINFFSCRPTAQSIVDEAIEKHGGDKYNHFSMSFDFRDKHYIVEKNEGKFRYERHQKDSSGKEIKDIMTNDSFTRTIDNQQVSVVDSMAKKYSNSINSVAYFLLLPSSLNDPAVNKELLGEVSIKNQKYHKVRVTFGKEGGGKDHDDVFIFWFNQANSKMDYLAYEYHVDGGGMRFREPFNTQTQNGIVFSDYNNFQPEDEKNTKLDDLDKLFEAGKLKLASKVENKNMVIK